MAFHAPPLPLRRGAPPPPAFPAVSPRQPPAWPRRSAAARSAPRAAARPSPGGGGASNPLASFLRAANPLAPRSTPAPAPPDELLPPPDPPCPCGSGRSYGGCCRRYHAGAEPAAPLGLLRARYTAYALGLPAYIMRTTAAVNEDYRVPGGGGGGVVGWRREILDFCESYDFVRLDVLEQTRGAGAGDLAASSVCILFRANMERLDIPGGPVSFIERATFIKEGNRWLYASGKLVDVDEPDF